MVEHARRNVAATRALGERGPAASVTFTGATLTAGQLATHARSEAAIHRWDIVGDDEVSDELLAQPDLSCGARGCQTWQWLLAIHPASSSSTVSPMATPSSRRMLPTDCSSSGVADRRADR
jgi:hypothetical protein